MMRREERERNKAAAQRRSRQVKEPWTSGLVLNMVQGFYLH